MKRNPTPVYTRPDPSCDPSCDQFPCSSAGTRSRITGLFWGLGLFILLFPAASRVGAQGDPGPQPTNPPQLAVFGSALSHLKSPWLEDRFAQKQGITAWRFYHAAANGQGDVYLGSVQVSPSPLPPMLVANPLASSSAISTGAAGGSLRFVYLHNNRSIPPDPLADLIFASPIPYRSSGRAMPLLLNSTTQLDLLIQICEWQQPGSTPPALQGFRAWLELPQTRITQIRARSSGIRTLLEFVGEEEISSNSVETVLWTISAERSPSAGFVNLEVTP